MIYGSVCSGIEAATVAWHPLGWKPAFFSEIESFPRAVLAHHYPETPLHGDFTTIGADQYGPIDLLVGGTPCQSFSIAGLRGGLDDERGNLALEFLRLAQRTRAKWLVWENVPGVLSSNGGRDFGAILGGMVELGYGIAYRVLDAQFFGLAQRRRRVFVVGCLGDWASAAAVLFERHSLSGHPAPSREKRESVAGTIAARFGISRNNHEECVTSVAKGFYESGFAQYQKADVGGTIKASGGVLGGGSETFLAQPIAYNIAPGKGALKDDIHVTDADSTKTLDASGSNPAMHQGGAAILQAMAVRRLTPVECERLQGFSDNYTDIKSKGKPTPDGPRYKALGNSMAVPVMAWIGQRIQEVEAICKQNK